MNNEIGTEFLVEGKIKWKVPVLLVAEWACERGYVIVEARNKYEAIAAAIVEGDGDFIAEPGEADGNWNRDLDDRKSVEPLSSPRHSQGKKLA